MLCACFLLSPVLLACCVVEHLPSLEILSIAIYFGPVLLGCCFLRVLIAACNRICEDADFRPKTLLFLKGNDAPHACAFLYIAFSDGSIESTFFKFHFLLAHLFGGVCECLSNPLFTVLAKPCKAGERDARAWKSM